MIYHCTCFIAPYWSTIYYIWPFVSPGFESISFDSDLFHPSPQKLESDVKQRGKWYRGIPAEPIQLGWSGCLKMVILELLTHIIRAIYWYVGWGTKQCDKAWTVLNMFQFITVPSPMTVSSAEPRALQNPRQHSSKVLWTLLWESMPPSLWQICWRTVRNPWPRSFLNCRICHEGFWRHIYRSNFQAVHLVYHIIFVFYSFVYVPSPAYILDSLSCLILKGPLSLSQPGWLFFWTRRRPYPAVFENM